MSSCMASHVSFDGYGYGENEKGQIGGCPHKPWLMIAGRPWSMTAAKPDRLRSSNLEVS